MNQDTVRKKNNAEQENLLFCKQHNYIVWLSLSNNKSFNEDTQMNNIISHQMREQKGNNRIFN